MAPFESLRFPASLSDERTRAVTPCLDRLNQLNLRSILVYALDQLAPIQFGDVAYWNDTWASAIYPGTEPTTLPHLAWQFNILGPEGWDWCVNDPERRALIKGAIGLYRLKGTLAAFRRMARFVGSEIRKAWTPPSKSFAAPSLTEEERRAFLSAYPSLRVSRWRNRGERIEGSAFPGHQTFAGGSVRGKAFPVISEALLRIQPRAYMVRDGLETELTILERRQESIEGRATESQEIRRRSTNPWSFGPFPRYLPESDARNRIYTLRTDTAYQTKEDAIQTRLLQPGLEPMETLWSEVHERDERGRTGFCERSFLPFAFTGSDARRRIFQERHLFDPEIPLRRRGKSTHAGAARLGIPHHHAELMVRIRGKANPKAAWRFCWGYLVDLDHSGLTRTLRAMQTAQRLSDRVFLNPVTRGPALAVPWLLTGQINCNDWVSKE